MRSAWFFCFLNLRDPHQLQGWFRTWRPWRCRSDGPDQSAIVTAAGWTLTEPTKPVFGLVVITLSSELTSPRTIGNPLSIHSPLNADRHIPPGNLTASGMVKPGTTALTIARSGHANPDVSTISRAQNRKGLAPNRSNGPYRAAGGNAPFLVLPMCGIISSSGFRWWFSSGFRGARCRGFSGRVITHSSLIVLKLTRCIFTMSSRKIRFDAG